MDDLDNFFGKDECDAFVDGMKFDVGGTDDFDAEKREFLEELMKNDDLLLGSLFGDKYQTEIKNGKYDKMSVNDVICTLMKSELSNMAYSKDKNYIEEFLNENKKQDHYNPNDMIILTRMLIKMSI